MFEVEVEKNNSSDTEVAKDIEEENINIEPKQDDRPESNQISKFESEKSVSLKHSSPEEGSSINESSEEGHSVHGQQDDFENRDTEHSEEAHSIKFSSVNTKTVVTISMTIHLTIVLLVLVLQAIRGDIWISQMLIFFLYFIIYIMAMLYIIHTHHNTIAPSLTTGDLVRTFSQPPSVVDSSGRERRQPASSSAEPGAPESQSPTSFASLCYSSVAKQTPRDAPTLGMSRKKAFEVLLGKESVIHALKVDSIVEGVAVIQ